MVRILAFAGSAREDSLNKRLARLGAERVRHAGGEATILDLRDHPMPLYDGDLEQAEGLPPGARSFKQALGDHDGILVACPEYNSSITPLLKNALDWASRPETKDEPPLAVFRGKTALLLAASPGALGGLRGLVHVRAILGNIGVHVLPDQLAVPRAHEAFAADGSMADEGTGRRLAEVAATLVSVTRRLVD